MKGFRNRDRGSNGDNDISAPQGELFEDELQDVLLQSHMPPSAEQLGSILRQSREQQGFSIGEMSKKTRIRDIYLSALEEGRVEKLPGATFVAGFLRLYAESLHLQEVELVERYIAASNGGDEHLQTDVFPAPTTSRHRPSVMVVLVGIASLLGLIIIYENYYSVEFAELPPPEIPSVTPLRSDAAHVNDFGDSDPAHSAVTELAGDGLVSRFFDAPLVDSGIEKSSERSTQEVQERFQDLDLAVVDDKKPLSSPVTPVIQQEELVDFQVDDSSLPLEQKSTGLFDWFSQLFGGGGSLDKTSSQTPAAAVNQEEQNVVVTTPPSWESPSTQMLPESSKPAFTDATPTDATPTDVTPTDATPTDATPTDATPTDAPNMEPTRKAVATATTVDALATGSQDPAVLIVNRYPEKVANADLVPEAPQAISMLASELVWVQIQDVDGMILKDMVMQPDQLFRVPPGGRFFATFGNAGGIRLRVGKRFIPNLGRPGEEIEGLELDPEILLQHSKK